MFLLHSIMTNTQCACAENNTSRKLCGVFETHLDNQRAKCGMHWGVAYSLLRLDQRTCTNTQCESVITLSLGVKMMILYSSPPDKWPNTSEDLSKSDLTKTVSFCPMYIFKNSITFPDYNIFLHDFFLLLFYN